MPCLARQAVESTEMSVADPERREELVRLLLREIADSDWRETPVNVSQRMQRRVRDFSGRADPYRALKTRMNDVALALLPLVGRELAEEADQRMAHVLGHLHRHAGIFEPHHLQRRRQAQRHQLVDARAEVEHGLELRLLVEQLLRRAPDQRRVVIGWQAGPPFVDLRTGQRGVQVSQPSVSRAAVAVAQQQLHAAPVPRRSSSAPSVT